MLCAYCGHNESRVIDSRDSGSGIRRRRECLRCGLRFTTYEQVQPRVLVVTKRDERQEDFSPEKLRASLTKACAKRPLPTGTVEKILNEIESDLVETGRAEIKSKVIGEMVMARLMQIDRVSYIRFSSVYRDFRDIETFKEEIDALLEPRRPKVPESQIRLLDDDAMIQPLKRRRRGRPRRPETTNT